MGKLVVLISAAFCYLFLFLVIAVGKVAGRHVHYYDGAADNLLLSDGSVSDHGDEDDSFLQHDHLKGMGTGMDSSEGIDSCHQMYGILPCSTNLPASVGLSKNEAAEEHLVIAVGLLLGSSILLLTIVWGFCIMFGNRKLDSDGAQNYHWLQQLTGYGVVTDSKTSSNARFMLVSLMPFIVILIPMAVGVSRAFESFVLFFSLLVAVLCLSIYLCCQYDPDCKKKKITSEYAKIERKMEMHAPFYEVQMLMRHRNKHLMRNMGIEMEKIIESNDDYINMIGSDGDPVTFKDWFFQKIQMMEDPISHDEKLNKVAKLLLEEKLRLIKLIYHMVKYDLQNYSDDKRRKDAIDSIFAKRDTDGSSSSIDPPELEHFLASEEKKPVDKEVVEMIMAYLDVDGNGRVDKKEFEYGMAKWASEIELYHKLYKLDGAEKNQKKGRKEEKSKAIGFVAIGMFMLGFFAEPLTRSVQIVSESVNIPPFYISFIFLPVATQARTAFAAVRAAKLKRYLTTSSTFSEIYHNVLMNNLMGFSLILCVMIYRGLTWHFSAEVLTLVIVCGVVGILTGFNSKFPNWTLIIAFPLYPLSLILFNLVNVYFR